MILITGSTGNLGTAVINQLLKTTEISKYIAFARNKEKAADFIKDGIEVRIGDFNDVASLESAFRGIKKLLLISTMSMKRFEQQKGVVDAAKKAGIEHIVYTGLAIKDIQTSGVKDLMISHFQTEDYIKESGLTYTFLRNTMYADAIPEITGKDVVNQGINLPGGSGKVPYALRREMGEATANLLLQSGHENKTYDIAGDKAYSYQDIAQELSSILKKDVKYTNITVDAYIDFLKKVGLPEFPIYLHNGTIYDIREHQYETEDIKYNELSNLLGRPTASLTDFLKEIYIEE